jgi:methyl-accepting chemotaxis protein
MIAAMILVVGLVLGTASIVRVDQVILHNTYEWQASIAHAAGRTISSNLDTFVKEFSVWISTQGEFKSDDPEAQLATARDFKAQMPTIDEIIVIDKNYRGESTDGDAFDFSSYEPVRRCLSSNSSIIDADAKNGILKIIEPTPTGAVSFRAKIDFLDSIVDEVEARGDFTVRLIDDDGLVLASTTSDFGSNALTDKSTRRSAIESAIRAKDGESGTYEFGDESYIYATEKLSEFGFDWIILVEATRDSLMQSVWTLGFFIGFLAIGLIIAAALVSLLAIASPMTSKIRVSLDAMESIAKGDLTITSDVKSADEIGDVAKALNTASSSVGGLIKTIRRNAEVLRERTESLTSNMTETATAIGQITSNVESIKRRILNQSASVTETSSTMQSVVENISRLNSIIESQAGAVAQASAAIEEMIANINSVTQSVGKAVDVTNSVRDEAEVGKKAVETVNSDIQSITKLSQSLQEINDVIADIAAQTNLLSMNAAIEAAHAGESGKGFAVVAGEIRKLAENSTSQSKSIAATLKDVKESIGKITRSGADVTRRFDAIVEGLEQVAIGGNGIKIAMDEQGEGSKQVLDAMSSLRSQTDDVKSRATEMEEGSKQVIEETKSLESATAEITSGIQEMAAGAQQINAATNQAMDVASDTASVAKELASSVEPFKV